MTSYLNMDASYPLFCSMQASSTFLSCPTAAEPCAESMSKNASIATACICDGKEDADSLCMTQMRERNEWRERPVGCGAGRTGYSPLGRRSTVHYDQGYNGEYGL